MSSASSTPRRGRRIGGCGRGDVGRLHGRRVPGRGARTSSRHRKIRLLHVLDDRFRGYAAGGDARRDAKLGLAHPRAWSASPSSRTSLTSAPSLGRGMVASRRDEAVFERFAVRAGAVCGVSPRQALLAASGSRAGAGSHGCVIADRGLGNAEPHRDHLRRRPSAISSITSCWRAVRCDSCACSGSASGVGRKRWSPIAPRSAFTAAIVDIVTSFRPSAFLIRIRRDGMASPRAASRAAEQPGWQITAPCSSSPPSTSQHGRPIASAAGRPVSDSSSSFHASTRVPGPNAISASPERKTVVISPEREPTRPPRSETRSPVPSERKLRRGRRIVAAVASTTTRHSYPQHPESLLLVPSVSGRRGDVPANGDGACRDRTGDLRLAKPALSQLS